MTITSNHEIAAQILESLKIPYQKIQRFTTGYCHQVYLVVAEEKNSVLRVTRKAEKDYYEGALRWLPLMRSLGIPVPEILQSGTWADYYYTHISHIPGRDLGEVYATLTREEKRGIAKELAAIQQKVAGLPLGAFYGYTIGTGHDSWQQVAEASLSRSRDRIAQNRVFSMEYVDIAAEKLQTFIPYFGQIPPTPFLDDITTKNVLIQDGKLQGIVDIDEICYGDPLSTIGLTQMALLSLGYDTTYISDWEDALALDASGRRAVTFYTLLSCVDFMSEQGMAFGNGVEITPDAERSAQLIRIFHDLLSKL